MAQHNHGPNDVVHLPDSCIGCLTERLTESLKREQLLKAEVARLKALEMRVLKSDGHQPIGSLGLHDFDTGRAKKALTGRG